MALLLLFVLSAIAIVVSRDLECKRNAPNFPGGKFDEGEKIREWFSEARKEWDALFDGDEDFLLWDEFDLGRDPKLLEEINGLDANTQTCPYDDKDGPVGRKGFPFGMRHELGYDLNYSTPSMYDWDEKMAKKGIVAGMQPPDEKEDWYLPLVYQTDYPYDTEEKIAEIVKAVKDWFKANPGPGKILFLKGTLGGGTGTSIKWCDSSAHGTASAMYRIKRHEKLEESVELCVRELTHFVNDYKQKALEGVKEQWANPAGSYGYPGFLIEPGFDFQVEVKAHVIWGKLFGIGTQTPHSCLHVSNGHNGQFIRFRGYDGDDRPTQEGSKTMWEVSQESGCSKVTDEMLTRVKKIAEAVGKHSDFSRIDIFINVNTGAMVVNEIESYYRVCRYASVNHGESMKLMAQTWVKGWQTLERRGKLKRITRPHARYQDVAPPWGKAYSCTPYRTPSPSPSPSAPSGGGFNILYFILFNLSLLATAGLGHCLAKKRSESMPMGESWLNVS